MNDTKSNLENLTEEVSKRLLKEIETLSQNLHGNDAKQDVKFFQEMYNRGEFEELKIISKEMGEQTRDADLSEQRIQMYDVFSALGAVNSQSYEHQGRDYIRSIIDLQDEFDKGKFSQVIALGNDYKLDTEVLEIDPCVVDAYIMLAEHEKDRSHIKQ